MLMTVIDGAGVTQKIVAHGQEAPTDHSGTIATTATSQQMIPPNALRSGWIMQNRGTNVMYVLETGADSAVAGPAFMVGVNEYFPPAGFPVTVQAITVLGTAGDRYSVREW